MHSTSSTGSTTATGAGVAGRPGLEEIAGSTEMGAIACSRTTAGDRMAERFVLEVLAGEGGMGKVYRAHDEQTGRTVALKVIRRDADGAGTRFARESDLLSRLRHPGIVTYVSHGITESGEPYLAMEWLDGEDLAKRLARGALGLRDSLTLLRRSAEALAVVHAQGVVHRDLKPSNLFLRDGQVERVSLLDFGVARCATLAQPITGPGVVVGTPGYMCPEQARGAQDVTPAADVFSLGCVLFECLTGQRPFAAEHQLAMLAKIVLCEPPRLRRVRPEMPEQVEALLERMLANDRAARLQDATAILDALTALEGLPLDAVPDPGAVSPRSRLVDTEQHLISVVMATPPADLGAAPVAEEAEPMAPPLAELRRALSKHGARVELLADGSLVATLIHTRGAATDQAAQAAHCALLIRKRWPGARIALSTGRGMLHERLPVGEVLDRAAALLRDHPATASASEQILIDDVTRGLLEVSFRVDRTSSGGYALSGEELELDASRPLLGKPTPCVSRDVELGVLESALAGCIEESTPHAVRVTAAPGIGKSRLRHEFLRRITARGDDISILIGRGDPMSAGSSYGLLGQALRRLCGILDGESLESRHAKLERRIGEHVPAAERQRIAAFVGEVCGAPFPDENSVALRAARQDPLIMSDQITQAMLDFLRAECAQRPMLIVLEDLHWGDELTAKLVETALRTLKDCPLMVLALARPEVNELFPQLWSGFAHLLRLLPLGKKAAERLVRQVLGEQVHEQTVARIFEQSAGHALFLEELIRAVAEGRGDEAPETVLVMLQARIGRLDAGARRVLRAASVFGATFWLGGIRALLGGLEAWQDLEDWLRRLIQDEILEQLRESRFPGERAYTFHHALMRDAAYEMFAPNDRVESHRRAGLYLEARGEPDARVLADHFLEGKEPARAIHYYIQAAEQSFDANDMRAVLASAERGLACGAEGEQRGALLSLLVGVYLWRDQYAEVIAMGIEAIDLLPQGSRRWCRTLHYLLPVTMLTQQVGLLAQLTPLFAAVEPAADARREYVRGASWMAVLLAIAGRKADARAFLERARRVCATIDRSDITTWGYLKGAETVDIEVIEDAPWTCMRSYEEGREAFRTGGDLRFLSVLNGCYGRALHDLGDRAGAESDLRQSLALVERLDESLTAMAYVKTYLARLLASSAPLDRLDEPAQLARDVIARGNMSLIGVARGALAEIAWRRGDLVGAEAEASAACAAVRPFPGNGWDILALWIRILLEQGRIPEALEVGEAAIQHLERLGVAGCGEIALRLAVAEARHAAGQVDAAHAMLADTIPRLKIRADDIPDAAARARYLTEVPANARLLALAKVWLGDVAAQLAPQ